MTKIVMNEWKPEDRPFRIGDVVVNKKNGEKATIVEINLDMAKIDYNNYDLQEWRFLSNLLHVEPNNLESKFKVGDKVVIIDADGSCYKAGDIGHVVEQLGDSLDVECKEYPYRQYFRPDQLERYVEQPEDNPLKKAWEAYEAEEAGGIDQLAIVADWKEQEKPKYLQPTRALDSQVGGSHYKDLPIQPVEFILANGLGFCEGSIIKYTCRYRQKGGIEDLKKVIHYAQLLIEDLEKETS